MMVAIQEAGGPCQRLAGQEPRRTGKDMSDDDMDVARLVQARQRRIHDIVKEFHRKRRHLLSPWTQVSVLRVVSNHALKSRDLKKNF